MKIAVTGATGFWGKSFVALALSEEHAVTCLVRSPEKAGNLIRQGAEVVQGDILNENTLAAFVKNADVCVHLAAQVHTASREQFYRVNVDGTENICKAIVKNAPRCRLVQCSSIATVRVNPLLPILSTDYALSKRAADRKVREYGEKYGLLATFVYPGLIYGPGDENFVPTLIRYLKKNKIFLVRGGESSAPLIYVDDLCRLFLKTALQDSSVGKHYLGIQESAQGIHHFIRLLARAVDCKEPTIVLPKAPLQGLAVIIETAYRLLGISKSPFLSRRAIDVVSINAHFSRKLFSEDLDWKPEVHLEDGLKKALQGG